MAMAYVIPAAGSYQIKVGAGKLRGLAVSSGTSVTFAAYDTANGTVSNATTIFNTGTVTTTSPYSFAPGDDSNSGVYCNKGIYVVIGGTSPRVTVFYE